MANSGAFWVSKKLTKDNYPYFTGNINGKGFMLFVDKELMFKHEDGSFSIKVRSNRLPAFTLYAMNENREDTKEKDFTKPQTQSEVETMDIPF